MGDGGGICDGGRDGWTMDGDWRRGDGEWKEGRGVEEGARPTTQLTRRDGEGKTGQQWQMGTALGLSTVFARCDLWAAAAGSGWGACEGNLRAGYPEGADHPQPLCHTPPSPGPHWPPAAAHSPLTHLHALPASRPARIRTVQQLHGWVAHFSTPPPLPHPNSPGPWPMLGCCCCCCCCQCHPRKARTTAGSAWIGLETVQRPPAAVPICTREPDSQSAACPHPAGTQSLAKLPISTLSRSSSVARSRKTKVPAPTPTSHSLPSPLQMPSLARLSTPSMIHPAHQSTTPPPAYRCTGVNRSNCWLLVNRVVN